MADKYRQFIEFLFAREQSAGDWRFAFDLEQPDFDGREVVSFVQRMFDAYATDLAAYSDWQLGMGAEYVFNNSCSDLCFYLRDGPAPLQQRLAAIAALKNFYSACLNQRCEPALGHLSQPGNQLNHFCYMLWDTTPLSYCEGMPESDRIYAALADVMQHALYLDNIACIESGLHGLGHLVPYYDDAAAIVRRFLERTTLSDGPVLQYARGAETGCVL